MPGTWQEFVSFGRGDATYYADHGRYLTSKIGKMYKIKTIFGAWLCLERLLCL